MSNVLQEQCSEKSKPKKARCRTLIKVERSLEKKWVQEETRELIMRLSNRKYESGTILEDLDDIFLKFGKGSKKERREIRKSLNKELANASMLLALDSHYAIVRTVDERWRPLVLEFCNQLVKEYDCKTYSEKALVEIAVGAYVKYLRFARRIEDFIDDTLLSHEKNGYMSSLGKQMDRASRTYVAAIQTLRQIKNPPVDFNVIAKTAFIAQNQQINAFNKVSDRQDEIITTE